MPLATRRECMCGADGLDPERDQRIDDIIERVAERRDEDHLPLRARLVHVVHDLWIPLDEQNLVLIHGLLHVHA
jgi:hypothetical protein